MESEFRIGVGHDTHRFREESGGDLRLGGLSVVHTHSLYGHSDADVLLHAITDALLGASGQGDIGDWFSDSDPANRGRSSVEMIRIVHESLKIQGWEIVNIDAIVFAEVPKLGPLKEKIRNKIMEILALEPGRVNVKAKTGEGVGPIGRKEAISAESVVLLRKKPSSLPR